MSDKNQENNDSENNIIESTDTDGSDNTNNNANSDASFDINAVIDTAKNVLLNPVGFYKSMPTAGGFVPPLIFIVVMCVAAAVISFVLSLIGLGKFGPAGAGGLFMVVLFPIMGVIASFIGAGIMFVIWKLMGSEKNYETAFQCVAYTTVAIPVAAVISIFPYLGSIAQTLIGFFLLYLASVHVHAIKPQSAKIVFGILAAIFVIAGIKAESTARYYADKAEKISEQFDKIYKYGSLGKALEQVENADEPTPEEAGQQVGEFLKSLEQFAEGLEESLEEKQETPKEN